MRRSGTIGGPLTYQALAELHRPVERQLIEREIRRLASNGLRARDIAHALKLTPAAVMDVLDAQAPQTTPPLRIAWPDHLRAATPLPSRPQAPALADLVGRMHGRGASSREIASELGLDVARVIQILASIAIPPEPAP